MADLKCTCPDLEHPKSECPVHDPPDNPSPLSILCKSFFAGHRFHSKFLKMAGKVLKKDGEAAAVEYLKAQMGEVGNVQPPAKCDIITQSRPFVEWPIYKVSIAIQTYIYGLTLEAREKCRPGTTTSEHERWFAETGVPNYGYTNVQGLNKIFIPVLNRYDGVLTKAKNRSEKKRAKLTRINEGRERKGLPPEVADPDEAVLDPEGRLLHPPGLNHSIAGYQQVAAKPYEPAKFPMVVLPPKYANYKVDASAPIPYAKDRLEIEPGQPGYVPLHHRDKLTTNKHKRLRAWYSLSKWKPKPGRTSKFDPDRLKKASAQGGALLLVMKIEADWLVLDGRGLLRNKRYRRLAERGTTLNDVLDTFTGDPVIDPKRNTMTFIYKPGKVPVESRTVIRGRRSRDALLKMTEPGPDGSLRQIGIAAVDLGQTNPAAVQYSRLTRSGEVLSAECLGRAALPAAFVDEIARYRRAHDVLEARLHREAIQLLSADQQAEVLRYETFSVELAKEALFALGVSKDLPWGQMTSNSTCISDDIIARGGDQTQVFFKTRKKKSKKETTVKRKDGGWASEVRPRLSYETRKALSEATWSLKRGNVEYNKLSKRKTEIARRSVNHVVDQARWFSQCRDIAIVIEDLNAPFFHGGGQRAAGWDQFFTPKKENRWFIQVLHKAFSDLAPHRGLVIIEVNPRRTSITCPACEYCDGGNRKGEKFACFKCKKSFHADLEVATHNILRVAMTGQMMPEPVEQEGADKKAEGARKRNKAEPLANPLEPLAQPLEEHAAE